MSGTASPRLADQPIDLQALLVAMVLVPHSYPRNRFFQLFQRPDARRVRRRASLVRSIIGDLADGAEVESCQRQPNDHVRLDYRLPELGARRSTWLSPDEFALLQHVSGRAGFVWPAHIEPPPASLQQRLETQLLGLLGKPAQ